MTSFLRRILQSEEEWREQGERKEEGGRGREDRNKMVTTFSAKGETKTQDCSRTMFDSVDTIVQKGPLIRPQRYSNGFVWRSR